MIIFNILKKYFYSFIFQIDFMVNIFFYLRIRNMSICVKFHFKMKNLSNPI